MLLEPSSADDAYHEPASVSITRLVCQTAVVLVVLLGAGALLLVHPEHANAAFALIGVVVGASFGLVRLQGIRRQHRTNGGST